MEANIDDPGTNKTLRLLSLGLCHPLLKTEAQLIRRGDGGGIRGISELIILQEIMHRVERTEKLDHTPLPADYFDLICGTSTGGYTRP